MKMFKYNDIASAIENKSSIEEFSLLRNNKGFSMLMAMASSVVVMITVLAAYSFLDSYLVSMKESQASLEKNSLAQDIRVQLGQKVTCEHAFHAQNISSTVGDWSNMNFNLLNIGRTLDGGDAPEYNLKSVRVVIGNSMSLGNAASGNRLFYGIVRLTAKTPSGRDLKPVSVGGIVMELDGSDKVVNCDGAADSSLDSSLISPSGSSGPAKYVGHFKALSGSLTKAADIPDCPTTFTGDPVVTVDWASRGGTDPQNWRTVPGGSCATNSPVSDTTGSCQMAVAMHNIDTHVDYTQWVTYGCNVSSTTRAPAGEIEGPGMGESALDGEVGEGDGDGGGPG